MIAANRHVGTHDIVLLTLDSLRYDVAQAVLADGGLPHLSGLIGTGWELRHTPGTFTFAAHQAFFAGFLPTPARDSKAERLFALKFQGSRSIGPGTAVFEAPTIVAGLAGRGYHSICIGGTGFFSKRDPLSKVLPGLFAESHWSPRMGVANPRSQEHQVGAACRALAAAPPGPVFLFINFSATHPPTAIYRPGLREEGPVSQQAALAAVDAALDPLIAAIRRRGPSLWVVTSDHGTAFGDDGYEGHRLAHPVVTDVPYAQFLLQGAVP